MSCDDRGSSCGFYGIYIAVFAGQIRETRIRAAITITENRAFRAAGEIAVPVNWDHTLLATERIVGLFIGFVLMPVASGPV